MASSHSPHYQARHVFRSGKVCSPHPPVCSSSPIFTVRATLTTLNCILIIAWQSGEDSNIGEEPCGPDPAQHSSTVKPGAYCKPLGACGMGQECTVLLTCAGTPVRCIDLKTKCWWGKLKSICHPTVSVLCVFLHF